MKKKDYADALSQRSTSEANARFQLWRFRNDVLDAIGWCYPTELIDGKDPRQTMKEVREMLQAAVDRSLNEDIEEAKAIHATRLSERRIT